jgi:hypothetical protein
MPDAWRPPGTPPVSATGDTALNISVPKTTSKASSVETQFVPPPVSARLEATPAAAEPFASADAPLPLRTSPRRSLSSVGEVTSSTELDPARAARRSTRLAWLGLVVTTATIVTAIGMRSPKTIQALLEESEGALGAAASGPTAARDAPSPSAPPRPPPREGAPIAELDAARLVGASALGALAEKYPNDKAVLRALLLAYANDKAGYGPALSAAKRLFELDPQATLDDDMRTALLRIVNGPIDVAALALEAFASSMGQAGPDLLYEVANDPSMGRFPRDRAVKLMEGADVKKVASPALLIAIDLKMTSPCKRKDLFARAERDGDGRALVFLRPLTSTTGCTKMVVVKKDCFACLGNRAGLSEAIKAIEERLNSR